MHRSIRRSVAATLSALASITLGATTLPAQLTPPETPTVIHAATVLDGRGNTFRNAWVVVRGGSIERVTTTPITVPNATIIELGTATLIGLD